MTIPNAAARYGLGVTYVENSGTWNPLKGMWINNADGTWHPVKTGWVAHEDGTWERIYPTPKGIFTPNVASLNASPYQYHYTGNLKFQVTNTGDYTLVINNASVTDNFGNYNTSTFTSSNAFPITLETNASTTFTSIIYGGISGGIFTGGNIGTFTGNINFTNYTGYLGYANVNYPVVVNVLPDFNGIGSNVAALSNVSYYQYETPTAQIVTITNTGNGADLHISNITSQHGYVIASTANLTANVIGYNFNTYTGNVAQLAVTPVAGLSTGTYKDTVVITSDALNAPVYKIPVTVNVITPNGRDVLETEGSYTWTVPAHVYRIRLFSVGSGAGGGAGVSNYSTQQGGSGGGGGSGGYQYSSSLTVVPGETLTISIGVPGGAGTKSVGIYSTITNYGVWSSFMNNYAVWVSANGIGPVNRYVGTKRLVTFPVTGNYTFSAQADNSVIVGVDGVQKLTSSSYSTSTTASVSITQGSHVIEFLSLNTGGIGGFALTIADPTSNIIWTTRTLLDPSSGFDGGPTTVTGSFGTITVAGGVAGGGAYNDYSPPGYYGDGQGGEPGDEDSTDGAGDGGGGC